MAELDLEHLKRRRSVTAQWELMHFATDEVDAILAALERIPELEMERDAMQRRAEAAESDWQATEKRAERVEAAARAVFTDMSEVREGTYSEFLAGGAGTVVAYKVAADVIDRLRAALAPAPEGSDEAEVQQQRIALLRDGPDGLQLIARERARQIAEEGWTPEHDDSHRVGELAQAAAAYLHAGQVAEGEHTTIANWFGNPRTGEITTPASPYVRWPWEASAWKPSDDPVRNLERAGALIAAEIDRLQRLAPASGEEGADG